MPADQNLKSETPSSPTTSTSTALGRAMAAAEAARRSQQRLLKVRIEDRLKADTEAVEIHKSILSLRAKLHNLRVLHARKGSSIKSLERKIARQVLHEKLRQVIEARSIVNQQVVKLEGDFNSLVANYEQARLRIQEQLLVELESEFQPMRTNQP